jgi:hypothetical protein
MGLFDITVCNLLEIVSLEGFVNAVRLLVHAKPRAIVHWATVCSSWVRINKATSGRTVANPLGRTRHAYVAEANIMVSRCALLILFGMCLSLDFILEQPGTSLMFEHPRIRQLQALADAGGLRPIRSIWTWMGAFGAPTPKPTKLLGTPTWMLALRRTIRRTDFVKRTDMVTYAEDATGKVSYSGSTGLKSSQAYPKGYGTATSKLLLAAPMDLDTDSDVDIDVLDEEAAKFICDGGNMWKDANVGPVWSLVYKRK